MTSNVHCEEFVERLSDLLERDVDESTRAALESHALACGDCGPLLADLRKLRIDASSLPTLAPTRDLWQGIAERIDAPVIPLRAGENGRARFGKRWARWAPAAAAAAVLIALTSTATYLITVHNVSPDSTGVLATAPKPPVDSSQLSTTTPQPMTTVAVSPESNQTATTSHGAGNATPVVAVKNKKMSAEQVYSSEIARLHTIVEQRRSQLDPVTISVIERNLKVIDDAIAQCRLALAKDPASRFLMESLNNALETKVELLRTATMLPTRS